MKFQQGNPGKPKGAISKKPKREDIIQLCEYIVNDLYEHKDELTTEQKVKILAVFKGLYVDTVVRLEDAIEPRIFNI